MPYSQVTLSQFISQIAYLLDDTANVYWTVQEITYAIYEALRVWGALTSYWRTRGAFNYSPPATNPYVDLSAVLPNLRPRIYTLQQIVQEIQYMLLENPSGISGTGMSQQISITAILEAVQLGRDQFVLDTHLPISYHSPFAVPVPSDGMATFPQTSVFVHRVGWQDVASGTWTNLWREDAWSVDKNNPQWTTEPGNPQVYSEAENAPLKLQLSPIPVNTGNVEALTVDSVELDLTDPASQLLVPDEWVHAIKYEALGHILSSENQMKDPLRAQYAQQRYQQAVNMARDARSIMRLLVNNQPCPIDSLYSIDAGCPYWRNQVGPPSMAGVLYDMLAFNPAVPDQTYGVTADVVQAAPLPNSNDFIQLGEEDLDHIVDYVIHILTFKCGGNEFKATMPKYDDFMQAVASRKGVNAAKIKYLTPLFAQPQLEWAARPDRVEQNKV